jgi:hypothetical protein
VIMAQSHSHYSSIDSQNPVPAYATHTQPRERSDHKFVLNNRRNEPWAILTFQSSARSPNHIPTFIDDEPITGSLLLDLDKKEFITSVSISVG